MEHVYVSIADRAANILCNPSQTSGCPTDAMYGHPNKVQQPNMEHTVMAIEHPDETAMFKVRGTTPRLIATHHHMPVDERSDANFNISQA